MKSPLTLLRRRFTPYLVAALAAAFLLAAFYMTVVFAFTPLYVPLQLGNYLYYVNTNIFYVREYAGKVAVFAAVTASLTAVAVKLSDRLKGEILRNHMPSLPYIEYWKENKKASAALLVLAYLALLVQAAAAALIWFNVLQEHLLTLYRVLLYSTAASLALPVAFLLQPNLDDEERLTEACKEVVDEVAEPPTKEDYRKIEHLTLLLNVMVTDAVLRNIKQIGELNPQPYLATITLAMIHGEKKNVEKAKQIAKKLLDHIENREYHLLLKTLTESEKQLPEIPKVIEKMEVTLNEPAQFVYAPQTRRSITVKSLIPVIAASTIIAALTILKWVFYFTTT